ncbi:hypothetical protein A9K55_003981 [Cordyceps militaris]|uniref:Uncharacterized protein n=1 Tax=Cordyceps militaris TaxID=73501 RepID=A0A2H4SPN5_CORMI|nr:hypothetical protein A9K55_003981 [Cordyceps militaris]
MNYAYDFQSTKLVHRSGKGNTADLKPPKPKAAPHRCGLDPEDLTRRLQFVIAERTAFDAKRQSRVVSSSSSKPFRTQETSEAKSLRRRTVALDSLKDKRKSKVVDHHQSESGLAARFRRRLSKTALDEQLSADPAPSEGPYVPQVAASQFADTTLGDSPPDKSHIHKLSRAALKYHMDGINGDFQVASTAGPGTAPIAQAKALRRAQTLREKNYDRNQFQASMSDNLEPVLTSPLVKRRSIYTAHNPEEKQLRASRRKSTGSFKGTDPSPRHSTFLPPLNPANLAAVAEDHRVDWTQSDEVATTSPPRPKSTSPAQSTKGESKWKFRGQLNSLHRSKEEKAPSPPADAVEMPKPPMTSIFARFRRLALNNTE